MKQTGKKTLEPARPQPRSDASDTIQIAHGGGGLLSRELIRNEILSRFGKGPLKGLPDAATLPPPGGSGIIFTTDSYVVQPPFFPGGNIGSLAVHGTVNDIAVSGGKPEWMSLALILEEGFPLKQLRRILDSVKLSAADCGVTIATGDTKVVPRGQCDGIYINTAGIGSLIEGFRLNPARIKRGDCIVVSGGLAEHGFAVLAARKNIAIENGPVSDSAPVHRLVLALKSVAADIRFMRDPTRGGLAAVLTELVESGGFGISIEEKDIPFSPRVRAISEMLGLDPLDVASEGRIVLVCSAKVCDRCVEILNRTLGVNSARRIGAVTAAKGRVIMTTLAGGTRLVDAPRGELLPRIC